MIKFIAKQNFNGRIGWSVVQREGSRKAGFKETLASDYLGSMHTAMAIAEQMTRDAKNSNPAR